MNNSTWFRRAGLAMVVASALGMTSTGFALSPFSATYQFSYGKANVGTATRTLAQQGNTWQYTFSAKVPVAGSATEVSRFSFNNGQIQSQSYQRTAKVLVHTDKMSLSFNPQQKQIHTSRKGKNRVLTWKPGVLDDLNAELQVREDLQHGGLKSSYWIADADSVDARQFVKEGNVKITAADGKTYDTIKIRLKHKSNKRNTYFWIAPSLDYLPVKVLHTDGDNSYGLLLKSHR